MMVHEAARIVGVTPRTLRFYEEKGLVTPRKTYENGYRSYSEDDLTRLRWIISLRELGMSVAQIAEAIPLIAEPDRLIRKVDQARAQLHEELTAALDALRAFDETITGWQREGLPVLEDAERAADRIRHNRMLRTTWSDEWNYDGLARQYGYEAPLIALSGIIQPQQYDQAIRRTLEWIDPAPQESGLETGAGSGNLTSLLCAAGAIITAVEQSGEMLSLLRERLPLVDVRQGNLLSLPLTQTFDFVTCSFALQHLVASGQLLALGEMDRTLKPGGRMVITGLMKHGPKSERISSCQKSHGKDKDAIRLAGLVPSMLPQLVHWLEQRSYSVVTEQLDDQISILYAAKQ
ncbi:MerR family transcriptional regulator [Paenibacillus sp. 1011MAR3C5]|uniref:MerR family transcriptional regulator n=1 Tax=Paenibacillus sp. 1011MAR3C5 TaxID=1675787 RepID=UPI000E6CDB63|nr:MerR family transcriptional regulator [Paenibacillus sp. 1011MAR3C5]RJE90089.1 MerR family transcriptional regulator [Paenibacillus sp. 1011MAR3C5]